MDKRRETYGVAIAQTISERIELAAEWQKQKIDRNLNGKAHLRIFKTDYVTTGRIKYVIMVSTMAKLEYNQSKSATSRVRTNSDVRRTGRGLTNAQKVEELKLGKFDECEPLSLPKKQIRRGWQITWGIVLLLVALIGIYIVLMTDPVRVLIWDNDGIMSGRLGGLDFYWLVMVGAAIIATICSFMAGIMFLFKKSVPAIIWYFLIIALTVGLLCASFHTFTWFEARDCYENYPGIYPEDPTKGSGCPSVVNELILLSLRNLAIYTVGIIALYFGYRAAKHHRNCKTKRR